MVDPFNNPALQTGEADNHAISTDSPYLKSLGLNVFTTGNLYKWYNTKDENTGAYSNRNLISNATVDTLLGTPLKSNKGWGEWYGWRKKSYTGNYILQKWNSWSWTYDLLVSKYTQGDLGTIWNDAGVAVDFVYDTTTSSQANAIPRKVSYDTQTSPFPGSANDRLAFKPLTSPIVSIIQMNRWMNTFKRLFEEKDWKYAVGTLGGRELSAIDIFLKDIKASKAGHVAFSSVVPFNINLADGGVQCIKHEVVNYKLFLYDDFKPRVSTNFAVLKNPVIRGVKKDATGRTYASSVDGEYADADPNDPKHMVVGELERSWNPVTQKWEMGTANMMGIVHTPGSQIDAAYHNPTVESLIHSDIKLDLDGDPDNHFAPSSGYVIPLYQQNNNPMQWQPNYAQPSGCREGGEANSKAKVIGFNFNPNKEYLHGSLVMLSKIGSIWHLTDMGSGVTKAGDDGPVEAAFDGKWEFQYLATNSLSFFTGYHKNSAGNYVVATKVDPSRVEKSFHRQYYIDDFYNGKTGLAAGAYYNDQFSTIGVNPFFSYDGWWQFSSFDFMDNKICGTRAKNALGTTQALVDASNRSIPMDKFDRNPAHSGPFFGCVFPDGYRETRPLGEYWQTAAGGQVGDDRPFFITKEHGGMTIVPHGPNSTPKPASLAVGRQARRVFDVTHTGGTKTCPFEDKNMSVGPQGGFTTYDPPRHDLNSAVTDPDPSRGFEEGKDHYGRTPYLGPSMFYMESELGDRSLKQLPADIGTLASPITGKNGGPFQDIHAFDSFHKSSIFGMANLSTRVSAAFHSQSWLRKEDHLAPEDTQYTLHSSAFDFKPKRSSTIQFRPLKYETYAQFFPVPPTLPDPRPGRPASQEWYKYKANYHRATWSAEGRRQQNSMERSASNQSIYRNIEAKIFGNAYRWDAIYNQQTGLLYNGDIPKVYYGRTGRDAADDGFYPAYQGRVHKSNYWNADHTADHNHWMYQNMYAGANAYGIIGACATVTANTEISFSTTQQVGMGSETWSSASNGGSWWQRPSWGGSDCDYNTNRTTELHATIYQQWPRTQTLFDSRYFAVHHFNPYPSLTGIQRLPEISGVKFKDVNANEVVYNVDTRVQGRVGAAGMFETDIRIPSVFGTDPSILYLAQGVSVWSDSTNVAGGLKVIPEQYWRIYYQRLGKLLPYTYVYPTLSIPWASGAKIDLTAPSADLIMSTGIPANTQVKTLKDKFVLVNAGTGYQKGDIVGNKTLGIYASVFATNPFNDKGEPIFLEVFDAGKDLKPHQSLPSGQVVDKDTRGSISMSNVATGGTGFEGYFLNSKVSLAMGTDQKPLYIDALDGRITRISAKAEGRNVQEGKGGGIPDFGFVTTDTLKSIKIDEEYRSANKKYDIFFHFHNDITHTWGNNHRDYANVKNPFENDEQYIQTSISSM